MSENYESPILLFEQFPMKSFSKTVDSLVISEIRRVGINVNKEELVKALAYDRGQYKKGYEDGYEDGLKERGIIRCKECTKMYRDEIFHDYWCGEFGRKVSRDFYCGAYMRDTDELQDT